MSDTGNLERDGVAEGDRVGDIRRAKRPFVMTPEKWKELYRPVMTPEMMESFTRYWFNKGKEGGSPPTAATFQQTGFDGDAGMLNKALDSFNRGFAASNSSEQTITNVIVQNAPALAQRILAASNYASAHEQIIVNVIVKNAPALAQGILAALPGANGGNQPPNGEN